MVVSKLNFHLYWFSINCTLCDVQIELSKLYENDLLIKKNSKILVLALKSQKEYENSVGGDGMQVIDSVASPSRQLPFVLSSHFREFQ
jgi:hypothetical protein